MNWYKDFYEQQFNWLHDNNEYSTENLHEHLVSKIECYNSFPVNKILELGGGSGQFAVAAALKGYDVTVIEISPSAVEHIRAIAQEHHVSDQLTIIQEDFYTVELSEQFDVVCYWDGFGIGSDSDQERLLKRIDSWLKPNGAALIDIYTPWFWAKATGQQMQIDNYISQYDFDAMECRMINTIWLSSDTVNKITQSLRCYAPVDLKLLLKETGLLLDHCEPSGEMDYENWQYHEHVPLERAMTYLAVLRRVDR